MVIGYRVCSFQIRMSPPSPFTEEEQKWVGLEFGAVKSIIQVRRNFRKAFGKEPRKVPPNGAFLRLVDRFLTRGEVSHSKPTGQSAISGAAFKYKLEKIIESQEETEK